MGWRPEIAGFVGALPGLRFTEVIAESVHPAQPAPDLLELRDRGAAIVPHGVKLSLGGAEPVDAGRVAHLAACAESLRSPLVSEHVAFVRAGGIEAGHLLPVPRTRAALDALTANIRRTQDELPVPLAVEPIAALFDWPDAEYTEADFLTELLERTGALLLLDVANVYANARNRGEDPVALLDRLPLERVAYCHVAGGSEEGGRYHDTHAAAVPSEVVDLIGELCARYRPPAPTHRRPTGELRSAPRLPGFLLERDGRYPPAAELRAELDAIAAASGLPAIT
ncbi:DUF692 domain-containing protein [Actinomadura soli]|uniref:DUF692 domain-containing protein n=1 Tax=Actinomadura soli TaxID=2508997 RepID=A0A5C4IYM4_9ACTN|nr:DUF692 domain-containing protein [Actinomadura soli]